MHTNYRTINSAPSDVPLPKSVKRRPRPEKVEEEEEEEDPRVMIQCYIIALIFTWPYGRKLC